MTVVGWSSKPKKAVARMGTCELCQKRFKAAAPHGPIPKKCPKCRYPKKTRYPNNPKPGEVRPVKIMGKLEMVKAAKRPRTLVERAVANGAKVIAKMERSRQCQESKK